MDKLEVLAKELSCEIEDIEIIDECHFQIGDKKYWFLDDAEAEDIVIKFTTELADDALARIPVDLREWFNWTDYYDDSYSINCLGEYKEIEVEDKDFIDTYYLLEL